MKFLNENNITKITVIIPPLFIITITLLIAYAMIKSEYKELEEESEYIRTSFISQNKEVLKKEIKKIKEYIDFRKDLSQFKGNSEESVKNNILSYTTRVLSKDSGYVFVLDTKGNVLSHPTLDIGSNIWELEDKTGLKLIQSIIKTATSSPEGGYVEYFWKKLGSNELEKKTTFTYYVPEWNWVIGMGAYMEDVENIIAKKSLEAIEEIDENVSFIVKVAIFISVLVVILSIVFANIINKIFSNYKEQVEAKEKKFIELNKNLEFLVQDETKKRLEKERELEVNHRDQLTSLPNRSKLMVDIESSDEPKLAILNIDSFGEINDYYGHHVGDEILKEIAFLLSEKLLGEDNIHTYKLSSDEFALLCKDNTYSNDDFVLITRDIKKIIEEQHYGVDENSFAITTTVGIAFIKRDIYIHADSALKYAKRNKKNFEIYDHDSNLEEIYKQNISVTKKLKYAIENDKISVFRQPIVNNITNEKTKFESLIRIYDQENNIMLPIEFLDISKRAKLYDKLTKTVIEKTFDYYKGNSEKFSINITQEDILNSEVIELIYTRLKDESIAKRAVFEIVESEGIENFNEASVFINTIKSFGAGVAIDDFGTGYSNFEYLMKLDVDYIKIDGSLIKNIEKDKDSEIIVSLIVQFAKAKNIKTVAEFVHSEEVLKKVKELGVDFSQGFFLEEPKEFI